MSFDIQRVGLFLQVRLNSTRMPGKAMLNLCGKPVIVHAMERLANVPADVKAILTTEESAPVLEPLAAAYGWDIFCGDRSNVLKRYYDAACKYRADIIIRATGDNPLVSSEFAHATLDLFKKSRSNYAGLEDIPYGSGVEVFDFTSLEKAFKNGTTLYEMEHVTPYIYNNPDKFKVIYEKYIQQDVWRSDVRVTVDTLEDYEFVNAIVRHINNEGGGFRINNIVTVSDKINRSRFKRMLVITSNNSDNALIISKMKKYSEIFCEDFDLTFAVKPPFTINIDEPAGFSEFNVIDYKDLAGKGFAKCTFDRVIVDGVNTTVEEMLLYMEFGPVISINDKGVGGQSVLFNIITDQTDNDSVEYSYNMTDCIYPFDENTDHTDNQLVKLIKDFQAKISLCPYCSSLDALLVYRNINWNAYKCPRCGLIYTLGFTENSKAYNSDYFLDEYKNQYGRTYEDDKPTIVQFATRRLKIINEYRPGKKLLDFGAGLGFFAEYARGNGFDVTGVDISDYCVEYMTNKLNIKAVKSDQSFFEKETESFDVITAFYVIEHLYDFEKFVFGIKTLLNSGGVIALSTPNGSGITIRKSLKNYFKTHPEDHYRVFPVNFMIQVLKKAGFKKIRAVSTGIHPERFISNPNLLSMNIIRSAITIIAKIFKLGDTFEVYAQKP